jgi:hypothetical protein
VDGDELSLGDHPMNLDVERADRAEEVLGRLQAVPGLRVVLNVVLDNQPGIPKVWAAISA